MASLTRRLELMMCILLLLLANAAGARNSIAESSGAIPAPRHVSPVIAVLALNEGTETTDFLVPYAVLHRARIAAVEAVAPRRGRVALMPALNIDLQNDIVSFDLRYPDGADYVIVPAMHRDDDPVIIGWIRAQAAKGAVIVAICSGALVASNAGMLAGRRIAGHWYDRGTLLARNPAAVHVPDRRFVVDRNVVTTTGVSASLPVSLAIVEAIAGSQRAAEVATAIGARRWGIAHDSASFGLNAGHLWTVVVNAARFWRHETVAIEASEGVDDVRLAFAADAWSRTYRSHAVVRAGGPLRTESGLTLIPDEPVSHQGAHRVTLSALKPVDQLDVTLGEIGDRYGRASRKLVELMLEYGEPDLPISSN